MRPHQQVENAEWKETCPVSSRSSAADVPTAKVIGTASGNLALGTSDDSTQSTVS